MAKTSLPALLLRWYDRHGRDLPWREQAGRAETPYHTWIAEIMLQQTGVAAVIPYYRDFLARWPSVQALADADEQDVLGAWAGLGYYSRARNLLKCAQAVTREYGGVFPEELEKLKKLPGIGDYTANAIRAIAFDKPANVVDGNVERVVSRIFAFAEPMDKPQNKKKLKALAATLLPKSRHGDYAQALMDLGATLCTPRQPQCGQCPWRKNCAAFARGTPEKFPRRARKNASPRQIANVFVLTDARGRVFLRQRPEKGLLAGLWEFPSTAWVSRDAKPGKNPFRSIRFKKLETSVTHIFSHIHLTVHLHTARVKETPNIQTQGRWFARDALPPLPTLTRKILAATEGELGTGQ